MIGVAALARGICVAKPVEVIAMPPYTVRIATCDDSEPVSTVLAASYPPLMRTHYSAAVLARALPLMTVANPDLLQSNTFYVAETDDRRIIGCGGWTLARPGTGAVEAGLAHIRHFATHPDWTGQGVARAIFETCRKDAASFGATRLECYASLNAQAFYAALGFVAVEPFDVALDEDVVFRSMRMIRGT